MHGFHAAIQTRLVTHSAGSTQRAGRPGRVCSCFGSNRNVPVRCRNVAHGHAWATWPAGGWPHGVRLLPLLLFIRKADGPIQGEG